MRGGILHYYSESVETARYVASYTTPHTMPESSLLRYVMGTKFSEDQASMIRSAVADGIPIQLHGIYVPHLEEVLNDRGLRVIASAERKPRRSKRYNHRRPSFFRLRSADGDDALWIVVFPSREYLQQVAEVTSAFVQAIRGGAPLSDAEMPVAVHYDTCDRHLEEWSGLRFAAHDLMAANDLVLLGYVDEVGRHLETQGFELSAPALVGDGEFGDIVVAMNPASDARAVLVGIYHSYWGSAAGLICSCLARAGASDVFYISKAGTLIDESYLHRLVNPDIHYVLEHQRAGHRESWVRCRTVSRLRTDFPDLVAGLGSGVHLTVPSVMGETIEQSEQYRSLRPATIDNEAGYIARELDRHNERFSTAQKASFTSIHFLTDFLSTDVRLMRDAAYDLSSALEVEGAVVRRRLEDALLQAGNVVSAYLSVRPAPDQRIKETVVPFMLPALANWIEREAEFSEFQRLIFDPRRAAGGVMIQVFGGPGVGKTRLVGATVRGLIEGGEFDFVLWLSLRADPATGRIPTVDAIVADLLRGLRKTGSSADSSLAKHERKLDLVLSSCAEYRCLLVFDDAEAVLERGDSARAGCFSSAYPEHARLFERLSQRSDDSVVVVLSRERLAELRPPWCEPLRIGGLTDNAASRLLRNLGLRGTEETLASLSSRYGGNPKALELVAPVILDDPWFAGAVDAFLRERSWAVTSDIDSLLEEVFVRLGEQERVLLTRIAVFDTTIAPLRAPAILAQAPEWPARYTYDVVIQALLRRNILDWGREPGTYELHPLIQEKALNELSTSASSIQEAHRRAYQYFFRQPTKPKREWASVDDVSTLIAAMKHACAAGEWIGAAAIGCDEEFRRGLVRWGAHSQILDVYQALACAPHGVEYVGNSEVRAFRSIAANMSGIALRNFGRGQEAIAAFDAGLEGADDKWRAIILGNLCLALIDQGEYAKAVAIAKRAIDLARSSGDRRAESYALGNLGIAYFGLEDFRAADEALRKDLALADGTNEEGEAHARAHLGLVALRAGEIEVAARELKLALDVFRRFGNQFREREFLVPLASVFQSTGANFQAAVCLRRAIILARANEPGLQLSRTEHDLQTLRASLSADDEELVADASSEIIEEVLEKIIRG